MARIMDPIKGIVTLLKGLSGGYDEELDDDILDENTKKELREINNLSAKNLSALENRNGKQTIKIEESNGRTTDRLGINKPNKNTGKQIKQGDTKRAQVKLAEEIDSERE